MSNPSLISRAIKAVVLGRHKRMGYSSLGRFASVAPILIVGEHLNETEQTQLARPELRRRLINAQEDERRGFADELCDLNQSMALLSAELDDLRQVKDQRDIESGVESLQKQMCEISLDLQQLSNKLYPLKVAYLGLAVALERLCRELSTTGEFNVVFEQSEFSADLRDEIKLCIFRIAEEALRNCMKHSSARLVVVQLMNTNNEVRLSIADDGHGFEMNEETMNQGLGLTSMRERLHAVGGKMTIRSTPCVGTLIEIQVPIVK